MKKRHARSLTVITLLLCAFAFILWSASMFCITDAVAQNYYDLLLKDSNNHFVDYTEKAGRLGSLYDDESAYYYKRQLPGYTERCMLDAIRYTNSMSLSYPGQDNYSINVLKNKGIPMQTAVIFYDKKGGILHESGDFVYFQYVTKDVWEAESEEQKISGYAWIDLNTRSGNPDPYTLFRTMYGGTKSLYDIRVLKITGYLNSSEIKPVKIDYVTESLIRQALDKKENANGTYTVSGLDHSGLFEWQNIFNNSANAADKDNLVTIYAMYPEINIYNAGEKVMFQGAEYKNLLALLNNVVYQTYTKANSGVYSINKYGLDEVIVFGAKSFRDLSDYNFDSKDPLPEPDFVMLTAISSHPLRAAVDKLQNVYIATFLLTAVCVFFLRKIIKRNLLLPLKEVNDGIAEGWIRLDLKDRKLPKWRELNELIGHYENMQDKLRMDKNEITRLNTALDYTKKSEQNRRQMTSNIAHELKTPLAVIHSYSEGLKEHIADDKRERYLDVILGETERMDAMVLEMLDLSRLEAGKVKLSRDKFSLTELARSVFDKLSSLAEEKKLLITFDFSDECIVNADEARINQVIMNFAANAIQYTPQGGKILVKTSSKRGETSFSIENESKPFSNEEISKVWETFYRADKSRSSKGTGLGLAIAKNIIDLHGGKCAVRNTKTGVEFSFSLPT